MLPFFGNCRAELYPSRPFCPAPRAPRKLLGKASKISLQLRQRVTMLEQKQDEQSAIRTRAGEAH